MGLDIYAGTMTRYYAHNWKSVVQQWAEENNYSFSYIRPDGSEIEHEEEMTPEEIQTTVENWRDQTLSSIILPDQYAYTPWTENNEIPYYTDKPDWDAFGALLLYAACKVYGKSVPPTVQKNWNFEKHSLIKRMKKNNKEMLSIFWDTVCWLPLDDSFLFSGSLPTGSFAMISTTGGLKKDLDKINSLGWQADESTILSWTSTEGYIDEVEPKKGLLFKKNTNEPHYATESLAKFAYSIFYRAMKFSEEYQVPILLDF